MIRTTSLTLFVCLGTCASALAQIATGGSIRGYIRDEQRAVLPGVVLTALSPEVGGKVLSVSDDDGYYRLLELPPGTYTISAELQGFTRFIRDNVVVRAGLSLNLDIELKVGTVTEVLEVKADTPMLESSTAVQGVNVSGELQRALPLSARRSWDSFFALLPGVVGSDTNPAQNVHGAEFDAHALQIDGADVSPVSQASTTYINLSTESIADVQVKTGGVDAASPAGLGAVVNVVTQSGTNQLKGAASLLYRASSWNGNNSPGGTSAAVETTQPDLALGGPVLKDRWWYFGAYRYTRTLTGVARTPEQINTLRAIDPSFEPFDNENRARFWFAKTTVQFSPIHQAFVFYQRDFSPNLNGAATWGGPFNHVVYGGDAWSSRLTSAWGKALTTRLGVAFNNKRLEVPPTGPYFQTVRVVHQGTLPAAGRLTGTGEIARLGGAPGAAFQPYRKLTVSAELTYYAPRLLGTHEIQTGLHAQPWLHYENEQFIANNGFQTEDRVLLDPNNPSAGTTPFHRAIYDRDHYTFGIVDSRDYAFYLQDAWRPTTRLTISPGIRIEHIWRKDKLFDVVTQDTTQVGPRFGVNYALTRDVRNTLRASWGRVFDVNNRSATTTAGTNNAGLTDFYDLDLDGTFETSFVTPATNARLVNRLFDERRKQPRVDEWTMGYRRQLRGQVSVDATIIRRAYKERSVNLEVNGIYEGNVFRGYRNEAVNDIQFLTNNAANWPVYTGLVLAVAKDTAGVHLLGSYTRQWRHLAGTWHANDPAGFIQPSAFANDKNIGPTSTADTSSYAIGTSSPTIRWQDHVVRAGATRALPWRMQVAADYVFQSGPWSGPILTTVSAPDPAFGPPTVRLSNGRVVSNPLATTVRFAFATRGEGQFKLPAMHVLNLRFTHTVPLRHGRLEAAVEIFNVTNNAAYNTFLTSANALYSPNYGKGTSLQAPRAGDVSLRFVF